MTTANANAATTAASNAATKALGFAETDGRLELQLVWGLPDVGKLRGGYEAMCRTYPPLSMQNVPPWDLCQSPDAAFSARVDAVAAPP